MLSLLLIFFSARFCLAESKSESDSLGFYKPSISNAYQGRLLYDPINQDYPIEKMIKLCEPFTGIDTAQTKCEELGPQKMKVCTYKCSMHWLIGKD
tara:strand:- start:222 stop:509 length:288 start_codon:yes stop_codon:yes gene_type:complete